MAASPATGRNRGGEVARQAATEVQQQQLQASTTVSQSLQIILSQEVPLAGLESVLIRILAESADFLNIFKEKLLLNETTSKYEFSSEDYQRLLAIAEIISRSSTHARAVSYPIIDFFRQLVANTRVSTVEELRNKITSLEKDITDLKKKLELSEKQIARLTLRQLLKGIETTLYRHFVGPAAKNMRDFKLSELDRKIKNHQQTVDQLSKLLKKIGFDPEDSPKEIRDLIDGYRINEIAHCDLEVEIPDENILKEKIDLAEINDDDKAEFMKFGKMYYSLKDELSRNAEAYKEVVFN